VERLNTSSYAVLVERLNTLHRTQCTVERLNTLHRTQCTVERLNTLHHMQCWWLYALDHSLQLAGLFVADNRRCSMFWLRTPCTILRSVTVRV